MNQTWLTLSGLTADFAGFILLLREWSLAFFHEASALEKRKREAWETSIRERHASVAPSEQRAHLDASSRIHNEMVQMSWNREHDATLRNRKHVFYTATVLIVIGYVLQFAGAVPPGLITGLP